MTQGRARTLYVIVAFLATIGAGIYGYRAGGVDSTETAGAPEAAEEPVIKSAQKDPAISRGDTTVEGRNHLAGEMSPYLLMHADNPVHWFAWGEAAFAKARAEDKPIFLSIGYTTCYWCHVMERESFSSQEVAALLNEHFVSIKVDREERPDVDEIYMTAVQMMGQRGGWPLSMFLTPDLQPFFGGTYFPKEHFMTLLANLNQAWEEHRRDIDDFAGRLETALGRMGSSEAAAIPGNQVAALVADRLRDAFDAQYGGFGNAPKFPQPANLEFLLSHYERNGDRRDLEMVTRTLDAMARGGIYDQVGRGFHRYSTDDYWRVPHFEKMLYDNAQLLHLYARAHALSGEPRYRVIAMEIAEFVERVMTGPDGLFYSAIDSETDHEEGLYYVWRRAEIRDALTEEEFRIAEAAWGLDREPFFDGRYVLYWPGDYGQAAETLKLEVSVLFERLAPVRDKLLAHRQRRKMPLIDDKVITAWNGLMIEALAYAGRVLEEPELVARARRAAQALLATLRTESGLKHVYRKNTVKLDAYLDDYAATILALEELHRASGGSEWLAAAELIADEMIGRLWDAKAGGFFYAPGNVENLLVRSKAGYDGAIPSGPSLSVQALTGLVVLGKPKYLGYAAGTLKANAAELERVPFALVAMVEGLADYHEAGLPLQLAMPAVPPQTEVVSGAAQNLSSAGYVDMRVQSPADQKPMRNFEVALNVAKGWHINANPASLEFLIPTSISARQGDIPLELDTEYPAGHIMDIGLEEPIAVYSGTVRVPATVKPAVEEPGIAGADIVVTARVQACNDTGRCLLPADITTVVSDK
ncbi:MAG: DUF255 domain-containing protein [Gammaproteobacteria bacterium]|nr:DUF255 domain-containing protein [Gammaproteobacteria bacterium]